MANCTAVKDTDMIPRQYKSMSCLAKTDIAVLSSSATVVRMDSKMCGKLNGNWTHRHDDMIATPPYKYQSYGNSNGPGQPSIMYILI